MQTLYLHAGMMKTGSTSIQVSLAANPEGENYRYLWYQANNSSKAMRIAFGGGVPGRARGATAEPDFRQQFLAYLDEQLRQDIEIGVLSAELVSGIFMAPHFGAMRDHLAARVGQVKLVVYIREPASFMESIYQQKLQEVGQPTIRPNALYPKYRRRFEPMEAAFGRENVIYRSFAPSRFAQGDIVWDFAALLGLKTRKSFDTRRANDSLSRRAASLLQIYHLHLPAGCDARLQGSDQKRRLLRLLHAVKGPKLRLAPELLQKVLRQQQADIEWISSRLDQPLPDYRAAAQGEGILSVDELQRPDPQALDWLGRLTGRPLREDDGPGVAAALGEVSRQRDFQSRLMRTREMFA